MHKTHNTLPEEIRIQSVELLDLNLAAAIDLHAQVKQAHWNVRGPGFMANHEAIEKPTTIEDTSTADLFTEISRGVDQQLWFVECHLAPKQVERSKGH